MAKLQAFLILAVQAVAALALEKRSVSVEVGVTSGLFEGALNGRVVVMFAPPGTDPLDDYDDTSSENYIFGKDVYNFTISDSVTLASTTDGDTAGVIGWPEISIADLPYGAYRVQAYLTRYDTARRSDGSEVTLRFPCGDGNPQINAPGSLISPIVDIQASDEPIRLTLNEVTPRPVFTGKEIGGCAQGNYEDQELLKYVKIRSEKLSQFWNRDMYLGANVLLPSGYFDDNRRYPVIYSQSHWPADEGAFGYPSAAWSDGWNKGIRSDTKTSAPQLIMIQIRHEAPYYDDSYAVNTANLGPWGDAVLTAYESS